MPWPWSLPRGKPEKRPYFHRTVEMKQPHTITEPKKYTGAAAGRKRFRTKGTKCKKDGSFRKSARPFYAMAGNKGGGKKHSHLQRNLYSTI